MENEIWKIISDYGGKYVISNYGRIRDIKAKKELKQHKNSGGYMIVKFKDGDCYFIKLVHRLVANQFFGKSKLDVNHINGIKTDNRVYNLEFVTAKQNVTHYWESGLGKHWSKRRVYQYSNGEQVRIWDNLKQVMEAFGGEMDEYKKCFKDINRVYSGYSWQYEKQSLDFRRKSITGI